MSTLLTFRTGTGVNSYVVHVSNDDRFPQTISTTTGTSWYVTTGASCWIDTISYKSGHSGARAKCASNGNDWSLSTDKYVGTSETRDITVYATAGTSYYCRIHAFASGGSFSGGSDNYYTATITSSTVSFEYDVTNLQTPTRAGYTFLGWGYSESAANYYTDKITISTTSQSSTSPGIYNLYAIWTKTKYDAYIRMGAGISSMSVYVDGTLKSYITDNVYHKLEVNLESSITTKAIGKKTGYEKPYTVNFYISSTSTTPSTFFESNSDEVEYLYYSHHKYAEITAKKANIDLFYWQNATWDAANIKTGQPISNLTATRWNNLLAKIKELAEAEGDSYSYTGVLSGASILATTFNGARSAISNRTGYGTLPSTQAKDDPVKAALFEGTGSLKSALNAAITHYNNS